MRKCLSSKVQWREGTLLQPVPTIVFCSHSETPCLLISERAALLDCCATYPRMEQMDLKLKATVLLSSPPSLGELVQADHSPGQTRPSQWSQSTHAFPQQRSRWHTLGFLVPHACPQWRSSFARIDWAFSMAPEFPKLFYSTDNCSPGQTRPSQWPHSSQCISTIEANTPCAKIGLCILIPDS